MNDSLYDIQHLIFEQNIMSKILNEQVDKNQILVTSQLKHLLTSKYLLIHRIFYVEAFQEKKFEGLLEVPSLTTNNIEIEESFASLEIPEEYSPVPIRTFLNNLFDSINEILPNLGAINGSKMPKGKLKSEAKNIFLRCALPAIYAYSWAIEPATEYAKSLIYWFSNVVVNKKADFVPEYDRWLLDAFKGFYTSLNLLPFVTHAMRPVFKKYIENSSSPTNIYEYAELLLEGIHKEFKFLPSVFNDLFNGLFDVIENSEFIEKENKENAKNELLRITFYEGLIKPILKNPILYGLSDIVVDENTLSTFKYIYIAFNISFGTISEAEKEVANSFSECQKLDVFCLMNDFKERKAGFELPSLRRFCDTVQCAHQPLLFTTKTLLVVYSFMISIQQSIEFPHGLKRALTQILQQGLNVMLDDLPEQHFWFQCFNLSYLGVGEVVFAKKKALSPLYRLLSSPHVHLRKDTPQPQKALNEALVALGDKCEPEIRTQLAHFNGDSDFASSLALLKKEVKDLKGILNERRERAASLNSFSRCLMLHISCAEHPGVPIALSQAVRSEMLELRQSFESLDGRLREGVEEFLAPTHSWDLLGKALVQSMAMIMTPSARRITDVTDRNSRRPTNEIDDDADTLTLRELVGSVFKMSAPLPNMLQLAHDVLTVFDFARIQGIERPIKRTFGPPFVEDPTSVAISIKEWLGRQSAGIVDIIFTPSEMWALDQFCRTFM